MKLKYLLNRVIILIILFLNYPIVAQEIQDTNQGEANQVESYLFGLQEDSPPISYWNGGGWQGEGYCYAFIENFKKRFPNKKIEIVHFKSKDRFTGKASGKNLDAECGPNTITEGRKEKEIKTGDRNGKFSEPFAWTGIRILISNKRIPDFNNLRKIKDLKFGLINGTTTKILVLSKYPSHKKFVFINDDKEAIENIKNGEIDVYFNDDMILRNALKQLQSSPKGEEYSILPERLSIEEYGIVVYRVDQYKNKWLLENINDILLNQTEIKTFGATEFRIINDPLFDNFIKNDLYWDDWPNQIFYFLRQNSIVIFLLIILMIVLIFKKWNFILNKILRSINIFTDGSVKNFIQPIFDTLDLYHNQGVDPRAIAISFKQLAENHPEANLQIVGIEVRGEDKFLLRAKTAATADKSELGAEYFDTYNKIKSLPDRENKLLIAEKDSRIRSLENFVNQALQRPSFYSKVAQVGTMTNNPGGFSVGGSVGGDIRNVQGDKNLAVQRDNNQAVIGDGNQVTQQNQAGADAGESLTKEDVVELLAQLKTLIQRAELPVDTKEEVIEDLSAANKATDKEEPNKQRALERLTSVAETLEKTTQTVDSGKKLWTTAKPIIVKVAGWLSAAAGSSLLGL